MWRVPVASARSLKRHCIDLSLVELGSLGTVLARDRSFSVCLTRVSVRGDA